MKKNMNTKRKTEAAMKIIYMGTPEFAVPPLKAIIENDYEVVAVFTQPDKPKGRSKKLIAPPVKEEALSHDIPVYQPEKLRDRENVDIIKSIAPDMIVVAAYGQILPVDILEIPPMGCINIHASLLPKYRGAAPIERCIIDGESETGVTTMYMAKGLDTGDMIDCDRVAIDSNDTGGTLTEKLSKAGAELIIKTMGELENGLAKRTPQDEAKSSYAAMLSKETGLIDFDGPAEKVERLMRGLDPRPSAYTFIKGKQIKLFRADALSEEENVVSEARKEYKPGTIIESEKKFFTILCGEGALRIRSLQPEGKGRMDAASYQNGNRLAVGELCSKTKDI